jgi:hypothetical protein
VKDDPDGEEDEEDVVMTMRNVGDRVEDDATSVVVR